ncbi:M42 family metallopeptidase [Thermogemmatispora sp.]|uniref:M42 family metallopeptidase n=1 Tax=Thermogemmatispora sp. TaxID=1968838 RepID=UPI002ACC1810|nr:M42 family metallopeptidase [Thermogemmatispora sp.]
MGEEFRLSLLEELIERPSPSGFEQPVQEVVRRECARYADTVSTDVHGNVIAALNPAGQPRLMLTAHCDELGLLVRYIDEQGFLYFSPIGGFDPATLPGERVLLHTASGPVPGVIGVKPIHLQEAEERGKAPPLKQLWIDIGASSKKEAEELAPPGTVVTRATRLQPLRGSLVTSRGLDDKAGLYAVLETLRRVAAQRQQLRAALYVVSAVQEEIGSRGVRTSAYAVQPEVAIAVDVAPTADHPQTSKQEIGDIRLGAGPIVTIGAHVNPRVYELLAQAAREAGLSYQLDPTPGRTATDVDLLQVSREGVATGLVSIPCRYLHTGSEIVSLEDIEETVALLTRFTLALSPGVNLIP